MTARADWQWKGEGAWRMAWLTSSKMRESGMGEVLLRSMVERRRMVASRKQTLEAVGVCWWVSFEAIIVIGWRVKGIG